MFCGTKFLYFFLSLLPLFLFFCYFGINNNDIYFTFSLALSLTRYQKNTKKKHRFSEIALFRINVYLRATQLLSYVMCLCWQHFCFFFFFWSHLDLDVVMSFGQLCAPRPEAYKVSAASATQSLNGF